MELLATNFVTLKSDQSVCSQMFLWMVSGGGLGKIDSIRSEGAAGVCHIVASMPSAHVQQGGLPRLVQGQPAQHSESSPISSCDIHSL